MVEKSPCNSIIVIPASQLSGNVTIPGDKVAAVHLSLASILLDTSLTIMNTHNCGDVRRIQRWITENNIASIEYGEGSTAIVPNKHTLGVFDLTELSDTRGNICLVTPLALQGHNVTFAGTAGCGFTKRGVDKHFDLMKAFGLIITQKDKSYTIIRTNKTDTVLFDCATQSGIPSVGVTCHALMAGLVYPGEIILSNCALEAAPSAIEDLVKQVTNRKIERQGTTIILSPLQSTNTRPATITLPPDVTVAATYIAAVTAAGGAIQLNNIRSSALPNSLKKLYKKIGVILSPSNSGLTITAEKENLRHPGEIVCDVWPAIPSDVSPVLVASLGAVQGKTIVTDNIYTSRATHLAGLNKLGYILQENANTITVLGQEPKEMKAVKTEALDIRAGAALVVGALASKAKSVKITNFRQIDRGYADFIQNIRTLGVTVTEER